MSVSQSAATPISNTQVESLKTLKGMKELNQELQKYFQMYNLGDTAFKKMTQEQTEGLEKLTDYSKVIDKIESQYNDFNRVLTGPINRLRRLGFTALVGMFAMQDLAKSTMQVASGFGNLVKEYQPFASAMWSLEDMAVKPFEELEDIGDRLTDWLDKLPEGVRNIIGYFQAAAYYTSQLFSGIAQVLGMVTAYYALTALMKTFSREVRNLDKVLFSLLKTQEELIKSGAELSNLPENISKFPSVKDILGESKTGPLDKFVGTSQGLGKTVKKSLSPFKKLTSGIGKFSDKLKGSSKAVASVAGGLLATVGITLLLTPLMESLSPVVDAITTSFTELLDPIQPIIDACADLLYQNPLVAAGLGVLAIAIGGLITAIGLFGTTAVATALSSAGAAIVSFASGAVAQVGTVAAALGPIGLIIAGIILAVGLLSLTWSQDWGGIREAFANAGDVISKGWTNLVVTLGTAWDSFAKGIKAGIDALASFFQPLIDIISYITKALGIDAKGFTGNQLTINNTIVSVAGEIPQQLIDALSHIPHAQTGGLIGKSGLAYVDTAELIVPRGKSPTDIQQTVYIQNTINGAKDQDVIELSKKISVELRKQLDSLAGGGI
jgi:phage-related minor tail protein